MGYKRKKEYSVPLALCLGAGTGIITSLVIAAVAAGLIAGERIGEDLAAVGAVIALMAGVITGSLVCARMVKDKKQILCLVCAGLYFLLLVCANIVFFDGIFHNLWTTLLLTAGGGVAAGLMVMKRHPQNKRQFRNLKSKRFV